MVGGVACENRRRAVVVASVTFENVDDSGKIERRPSAAAVFFDVRQPTENRSRVVRAGVRDVIFRPFFQRVRRRAGFGVDFHFIERKLKNLHSRKTIVVAKSANPVVHHPQILGDERFPGAVGENRVEKRLLRARFPTVFVSDAVDKMTLLLLILGVGLIFLRFPGKEFNQPRDEILFLPRLFIFCLIVIACRVDVFRGAVAGEAVKIVKTDEVVETNEVEARERFLHAAAPPVEIGRAVPFPTVKGRAPTLSVRVEIVRRNARFANRSPVEVDLKEIAKRPNVGAVLPDVNRDVAEKPNVAFGAIGAQFVPLDVENELQKAQIIEFVRLFFGKFRQRRRVATPEFKGPIAPRGPVFLGKRREKNEIFEPKRIFVAEVFFERAIFRPADAVSVSLERFAPTRTATLKRGAVIDAFRTSVRLRRRRRRKRGV